MTIKYSFKEKVQAGGSERTIDLNVLWFVPTSSLLVPSHDCTHGPNIVMAEYGTKIGYLSNPFLASFSSGKVILLYGYQSSLLSYLFLF